MFSTRLPLRGATYSCKSTLYEKGADRSLTPQLQARSLANRCNDSGHVPRSVISIDKAAKLRVEKQEGPPLRIQRGGYRSPQPRALY